MTDKEHTASPEIRKIWFLDFIRGRIGHEFTMEQVTTLSALCWLTDEPELLKNKRKCAEVTLRAYFAITQFHIDELVEQLGHNHFRITDAGVSKCKEVMAKCGLDGANDNVR